ncbi:MAG: hypothetical protein LW650_02535 [Planctomycetaceae bacterium]|jgi:hypothetical protein|nr:hypothetical protein [Phycisphaerales bacterium]MCE2652402.1 hypothetical protein [Planctomycetaceae bacterium]
MDQAQDQGGRGHRDESSPWRGAPAWRAPDPLPQGELDAQFDAVADLFLSGQPNPPASSPSPVVGAKASNASDDAPAARPAPLMTMGGPVPRELVVIGHVPTMAAAWVTQYVRRRAEQLRVPVLAVRISGDWLRVELHGPGSERVSLAGSPTDAVAAGLAEAGLVVISGAPAGEAALATNVLDPDAVGEAVAANASVAVLTGVDEASTVAAYRAIKGLAATLGGGLSTPEAPVGRGLRRVRLVTVGGDDAAAAAALSRLSESVRPLLREPLVDGGRLGRAGGGLDGHVLYDGPLSEPADRLLLSLSGSRPVQTLGSGCFNVPGHATSDHVMALLAEAEGCRSAPSSSPSHTQEAGSPAVPPPIAPPESPRSGRSAVEVYAASHHSPAAEVEAKPMQRLASPSHTVAVPPSGAPSPPSPGSGGLERALGLRGIDITCPAVPAAVLATDSAGTLHVLITDGSVPGFAANAPAHDPAAGLLAAAGWAWAQRSLLERLAGCRLAAEQRPVMHLLTAEPARWRALLESELKIHALLAVPAGATHVAAPLN